MNAFGPLTLVTAPTAWPVSVTEAQEQCLIEGEAAQLQTRWFLKAIKRATRYCEQNIPGGRPIMSQTWDMAVRCWWSGSLKVPKPPLQSVSSIKYYDSTGTQQTVSSGLYAVHTPTDMPGEIELLPSQTWPGDYGTRQYPIVIRAVVGFAVAPETISGAVLLLVAHWFANRESVLIGSISKELEFAVTALLESEEWGCYA